jgi:hypothetical protein
MANHNSKGLFGRILRAFRSSCGADDDAWADLSPWDLCVNSYGVPQPPSDIPRVVSIAEEGSDTVSGLHTINQTRGPMEQKSSFESEADLSEIFAFKTIRKRPESKHKRRDSPPSQDYEKLTHGLASQYVRLGNQQNLPVALTAEQPRQEEKVVDDIPRNIYTRPRVQHHIVRL